MSALKKIVLHVPTSTDAEGLSDPVFVEISDLLDHLATMYAWHPYAHGFLTTRAGEARHSGIALRKECGKWTR